MASPLHLPEDAFGDPFRLEDLPLPRPGTGYAVQRLGSDTLLDRRSGEFLPIRDPALDGLFGSFEEAHAAAGEWMANRSLAVDSHPLAIVPASYDRALARHVLIYGVLTGTP